MKNGLLSMAECGAAAPHIEPGIAVLCDALNRIDGVRTLWSCEGHPSKHLRQYVVFEGPEAFAFAIHQALCHPAPSVRSLRFVWKIVANFRDDGTLQWIIDPNHERIAVPGLFGFARWTRKQADADILALSKIVESLDAPPVHTMRST